jgi:hypothetical protein
MFFRRAYITLTGVLLLWFELVAAANAWEASKLSV